MAAKTLPVRHRLLLMDELDTVSKSVTRQNFARVTRNSRIVHALHGARRASSPCTAVDATRLGCVVSAVQWRRLTERGQALGDGGEDVEQNLRLDVGDERHVVLRQTLEQRVVTLTQLRIVLHATHKPKSCRMQQNLALLGATIHSHCLFGSVLMRASRVCRDSERPRSRRRTRRSLCGMLSSSLTNVLSELSSASSPYRRNTPKLT